MLLGIQGTIYFFYAGFCVLLGRSCLLQNPIYATLHIFSCFSVWEIGDTLQIPGLCLWVASVDL